MSYPETRMPENQQTISIPDTTKAIIREVTHPDLAGTGIRLFIKREDMIHEYISGNKWRKLKFNLVEAKSNGYSRLMTFGGAYSNHIYAVAAAGRLSGFETVGVIRGDPYEKLNPTLRFAEQCGMSLHYLNRAVYREKYSREILDNLNNRYGQFYLIPEGGSNVVALKGCIEMVNEIKDEYDMICLPCGTGGTLAGILEGLNEKSFILGFPVLKNGSFLRNDIDKLNKDFSGRIYSNFRLNTRYHFGGFAKFDQNLTDFINDFKKVTGIPLDPIYTGKMMFGIFDLIRNGRLRNMKILAIHTGGLQGIAGFNERFGNIIL